MRLARLPEPGAKALLRRRERLLDRPLDVGDEEDAISDVCQVEDG